MGTDKVTLVSIADKSVVEKIVDQITDAIINGELQPGDKIPTEPELCESFGVGRNSVREAIKILAAYGVLEIRRADGTYICKEYNDKMLYPVLYGIILQKDSQKQVVELRKVIDVGIMQEAMKRMDKEAFQELEQIVGEMEIEMKKENPNPQTVFEVDVQFHAVMTAVLSNNLLASIEHYVDKVTRRSRVATVEYILQNHLDDEFVSLHREILEILQNKEESQIAAIIEKHYQYWDRVSSN